MGMRWNPWRELRQREHLTLRWGSPYGHDAQIDPAGVVWIHPRLGRVDRRAALAHELVHDERGIFYVGSTPAGLVAKEEDAVERIVARRLVPLDELAAFVRSRTSIEPVTVAMVAEEFDVPGRVAERAMGLLRHPSARALRLGE